MLKRIRKTKLKTNPRFPGIAFLPDPSSPSSEASFFDDLIQIQTRSLGAELLADIGRASPGARKITNGSVEERKIKFPKNINVIAQPTTMSYIQSGSTTGRAVPEIQGRTFYPTGNGCEAQAGDMRAASDGKGSVSLVRYTNTQLFTASGEDTFSFIVLAHELIHSLNHLRGTRHDSDEEPRTMGLGQYASEKYSENAFRQAFNLPNRRAY